MAGIAKGSTKNEYSPKFIAEVLTLYKSGDYTANQLSEKYKVPERTIYNWTQKHNVQKGELVDKIHNAYEEEFIRQGIVEPQLSEYVSKLKKLYGSRSKSRLKQYGITQHNYVSMYIEQRYCCKICTKPFTKTPNIDHDHKTGKVRGLLCDSCNRLLGQAHDDQVVLARAILYLQESTNEA